MAHSDTKTCNTHSSFKGGCVCGNVTIQSCGNILFNHYCHCHYCRQTHACDFVHLIGFPADSFTVVSGQEHLRKFSNTSNTDRYFCSTCGTKVYLRSKGLNVVATFPGIVTWSSEDLRPQCHVNYSSRNFDVYDNLPKYSDLSLVMGGSGIMLNNVGAQVGVEQVVDTAAWM